MPFLSPCPLHWVWSLRGSLSVVATCRDVLGAGSVLGHHPVTVALAAPHRWARVVNKNPDSPARKRAGGFVCSHCRLFCTMPAC
jgi:hypothetical protein